MSQAVGSRMARRRRWLITLPLVVFAGLALLFFVRLHAGDPSRLPSALIDREVPDFALPPVEGLLAPGGGPTPGLDKATLEGRVSVVNVWASWCLPCRAEHPFLIDLAGDARIQVVGINYKDDPANARRFLGQLGNPFAAIGADQSGRTAIDWGVYGVPETFIVDAEGRIRHKQVGPIDAAILKEEIKPAIEKVLAGGS